MNHGNIEDIVAQIASDAGIGQPPSVNEAFVKLSQPSALMIAVAVVGLAIIIMASILVIYCIFYISIISSIKKYGQLRTIGMTAKQIKRLVFKEGSSLTLVAIPIGLITGTLLCFSSTRIQDKQYGVGLPVSCSLSLYHSALVN